MSKLTGRRSMIAFSKQMEKRKKEVGALRDKIRAEINDAEDLAECCDRAYEDIRCAIDALSEQV